MSYLKHMRKWRLFNPVSMVTLKNVLTSRFLESLVRHKFCKTQFTFVDRINFVKTEFTFLLRNITTRWQHLSK